MAIATNVLKLFFARVVVYVSPLLVRFCWFLWIINRALYFMKRSCLLNL